MPRRNLIRNNIYPYHVTIRCNNREWFELPLSEVWNYSTNSIKEAYKDINVDVHAFVLMSNHYHLLITTPDSNLDKFMYKFNSLLSKKIRTATGRINRIFGDRYKWSIVDEQKYFYSVLRYIYQNPVKANFVNSPELYPYSSLFYINGHNKFVVPLTKTHFGEWTTFIQWLNNRDDYELINKGVQKSYFKLPVSRSSRRLNSI